MCAGPVHEPKGAPIGDAHTASFGSIEPADGPISLQATPPLPAHTAPTPHRPSATLALTATLVRANELLRI